MTKILNTFKCTECGREFESLKKNPKCPKCKHKANKLWKWNGLYHISGDNSASINRMK